MKQTKKLLALLLCLGMVAGLAACGGGTQGTSDSPAPESTAPAGETTPADTEEPAGEAATDPDSIDDNMTSADNTYQVAFVTDVGQLKDKSFNQGTFDGVKLYAANNGLSYKYYQPANGSEATDDDRYDAMKAAVDSGAMTLRVMNLTTGNPDYRPPWSEGWDEGFISDLVERGTGYHWTWSRIYQDMPYPRPYIRAAEQEVIRDGTVERELRRGLSALGHEMKGV